jgi:methanogenic corrinoid protein MtbC1
MLLKERAKLAGKLRDRRFSIAEEFASRFPNGSALAVEDVALHLAFLAGAIETGKPSVFEDYVRWVARTIVPRGGSPGAIIDALERIPDVFSAELSEREKEVLLEFIEAGTDASLDPSFGLPQESPAEVGANGTLARFTDAILSGESRTASAIAFHAHDEGRPVQSVYLDIFEPALRKVGALWEANKISVAEEHMATAVVQSILPEFFSLIPAAEIERGHVIVTGVQGELHGIGAHMIADMLQADGWTVRLLGPNTPPGGIVRLIERQRAGVLGMSAATLLSIPSVTELIEAVHQEFGRERPHIIVGGGAFRSLPDLWREIGADGYAPDLIAAVQTMRDPRWMRRSHA